MANTPYFTKAESEAKTAEAVREIKQNVLAIGAGEGGKIYDRLSDAQAVDPKPANGTVFQVSKLDTVNSGVYTFQSGETGGVRFERPLNEIELETGVNLFNKESGLIRVGYYVSHTSGNYAANSGYTVTGKIPIPEGTTELTATYVHQRAFFDTNGDYISGISSSDTAKTFPVPVNARYIDCSLANASESIETFMIVAGSVIPDVYIGYKRLVPSKNLKVKNENIVDNSISPDKTTFFGPSKNLFNPNDQDYAPNKYLSGTGLLSDHNYYNTTGFILLDNTTDKIWFSASNTGFINRLVVFYDRYKSAISYVSSTDNPPSIEIPSGAIYVRVSFSIGLADYQIEIGDRVTNYIPFGEAIKEVYVNIKDDLKLFLPNEICIAVGRTIELYNSQVAWTGNLNDYHFLWEGIGSSMKRKWTCSGVVENIGEYVLTLKIYNKDNNFIKKLSTTVKIVDSLIATAFSLAAIGDSLSSSKPWYNEVKSLSGSQISYVGTRAFLDEVTFGHEGRSGVASSYYLGNNSYTYDTRGISGNDGRTQNLNPFWNPSTSDVDFNYYRTNYNQAPDKLMIWLGTNGITVDPTTNALNIKTFIDKIRATGGDTIPIFVVHTLFRGNQDGLGKQTGSDGYNATSSYKLEEDLKVFNLQVELHRLLKDYTNVHLIPVSTCHDSEYNFGAIETPVNPRASQMEYLPVEATHPQTQGYLQIADVMFSSIAAHQ